MHRRVAAALATLRGSEPGQVIARYAADRVDLLAAVVAYNALFSLFPIVLANLSILGLLLRDPATLAQAEQAILGVLPPELAGGILQIVAGTRQEAELLGVGSLAGLVWAGSGLFGALEVALNLVYRLPERPFLRQKLVATAMVGLFAALVVVVLVATAIAQFVGDLARLLPFVGPGLALAIALVSGAVSLLAALLLCFAIYYVVPNCRLTPREVLPGTLFAALGLLLLAQLFPLYARLAGGFDQYGAAFGLALLTMTWSHLVAQVLLLGAEINAYLHPRPADGPHPQPFSRRGRREQDGG